MAAATVSARERETARTAVAAALIKTAVASKMENFLCRGSSSGTIFRNKRGEKEGKRYQKD